MICTYLQKIVTLLMEHDFEVRNRFGLNVHCAVCTGLKANFWHAISYDKKVKCASQFEFSKMATVPARHVQLLFSLPMYAANSY